MRVLRVRNIVFVLMLLAVMVAAKPVSAAYDCNVCYGWGWTTEYCTPAGNGESGRTTCVDPNAGWTNCSLSGGTCTGGNGGGGGGCCGLFCSPCMED